MRLRNLLLLVLAFPLFKWAELLFPGQVDREHEFDLSEALNEEISWSDFFQTSDLLLMMFPFLFVASVMVATGLWNYGGDES